MRRGAILVVPMWVFKEQGIELTQTTGFVDKAREEYRGYVLGRLGVCPAAIQACDRWWEEMQWDAILFRFQTGEDGSTMQHWGDLSRPDYVYYTREYRVDALNARFSTEASEPDDATTRPRRLVSLEG